MIKFIGNRAAKLFQRAIDETADTGSVLITYWDTYTAPEPEIDLTSVERYVSVLPRPVTNPIDDKGRLGDMMVQHSDLFPRTYDSVEEIPEEVADSSLWFLKNRHGAGGKQVECVRLSEIREEDLGQYDILQEAVTDLKLMDGRKYTIRAYSIIWNEQIHLYKKWYRIIHGGMYSANATDYRIQVSLRYDGNETTFLPQFAATSIEEFDSLLTANQKLKDIMSEIVEESDRDTYSILGCDFLIEKSGNAKLIEINAYPNLVHLDKAVAEEVNYPMIRDLVSMIISEQASDEWVLV